MALEAAHHYLQLAISNATSSPSLLLLLLILVPLLLLASTVVRTSTNNTSSSSSKRKLRLPPSPPGKLPIIGHSHLIGSQTHLALRDLVSKHGHNGLLFIQDGAVPTVIVSSPRAAEAVMRTNDHILSSRPWSMASHILRYDTCDVAFSPLGDYWQKTRKLVNMHLLSAKKVYSFRHGRHDEVRLVIDKIRDAVATAPGTALDMSEILAEYTNDVVSRSVLGAAHRKDGRNTLFRELTMTNVDLLVGFNIENYVPRWPMADVLMRLVCYKVTRHLKRWDALLEEVIKEHVHSRKSDSAAAGENNNDDNNSADFIHVLLALQEEYGLTDDNVKSLLMNIFEAAIETSYLVLESAMAELVNNRHIMKRLQNEVRTYASSSLQAAGKNNLDMIREDDLGNLPYLKATVKESLRLHPPGPLLLPHYSIADCSIDGFDIPAKTRVLVNGWAIGRDPESWERPDDFLPERFLEESSGGADHTQMKLGQDFKYLPFGSGRRICPGANFANATMEIMLANLMYHFDWEVPNGTEVSMAETFGLMLRRNEKLHLIPRAV